LVSVKGIEKVCTIDTPAPVACEYKWTQAGIALLDANQTALLGNPSADDVIAEAFELEIRASEDLDWDSLVSVEGIEKVCTIDTPAPVACEYKWTQAGVSNSLVVQFAALLGNPMVGDVVAEATEQLIKTFNQWDALVAGKGIEEVCGGCVNCCSVPNTAGYSFSNAGGNVKIPDFEPLGVTCADGYRGTVNYTVCPSAGTAYSVSGCYERIVQRVRTKVALFLKKGTNATSWISRRLGKTVEAMLGEDATTADVVAVFKVKVETTINPTPTEEEALDAFAEIFNIPTDQITVTISRIGGVRRLQEGASVTGIGATNDPVVADAASAAADEDQLKSALLKSAPTKFNSVELTVTEPTVEAGLEVVQEATDAGAAADLQAENEQKFKANEALIVAAAGAQSLDLVVVVEAPTMAPTSPPDTCTVPNTVGYTFSSAAGTLTIRDFGPIGVTCSEGYRGFVSYTACPSDGTAYSVSGCLPYTCLVGVTSAPNRLQCSDGNECSGMSCCADQGLKRIQCPPELPIMCSRDNSCAGQRDMCCNSVAAACSTEDGPATCSGDFVTTKGAGIAVDAATRDQKGITISICFLAAIVNLP
jgi:hypothetical protein